MNDSQLYTTTTTGADAGSAAAGNMIGLAILVVVLASMWKVFTKAGRPGWAAIIPIYNTIVLLQIVGRPVWWLVLLLIPFVNIIFAIIVMHDLSKSFGRGVGTTLLLLFLPFIGYPILGFGSAKYVGPSAA
jgi:hypothetical protein